MSKKILLVRRPEGDITQLSSPVYLPKVPDGSIYVYIEREALKKYRSPRAQWNKIIEDYGLEIHYKGNTEPQAQIDMRPDLLAHIEQNIDIIRHTKKKRLEAARQARLKELDVLYFHALELRNKAKQNKIKKYKEELRNWDLSELGNLTDPVEIKNYWPFLFELPTHALQLPKFDYITFGQTALVCIFIVLMALFL